MPESSPIFKIRKSLYLLLGRIILPTPAPMTSSPFFWWIVKQKFDFKADC